MQGAGAIKPKDLEKGLKETGVSKAGTRSSIRTIGRESVGIVCHN